MYQFSNEPNTVNAFQEADLIDSHGNRIVNFYHTVTTRGWTQLKFNVTAYAGRRLLVYFGVVGNGDINHETFQMVDDVSLTGSSYPATGARIGGALVGPDGGYGPAVIADAFDFPVQHGFDGAGRATGVAISGDYSDKDLYAYLGYFGIARGGTTTRVQVDGGAPFNPRFGSDSTEAALDVETIVALAPSTQLYMYLFPDLSDAHILDGYNRAVSDNAVDVVNSSFGGCELSNRAWDQAVYNIVAQGAAKGITFAASSGDSGSAGCGGTAVQSPASTPDILAVGGTSLFVYSNGSYRSETAWKGSGGGLSRVWALPSYQSGIRGVVGNTRNVPDIAYPADPATGTSLFFAGSWRGPEGGTSWACPIFSALQTQTNQRRNSRAGFVNTRVYNVARNYGFSAFHDIVSGSNGAYSAHSLFDDVTGIGTIKGYFFSGVE